MNVFGIQKKLFMVVCFLNVKKLKICNECIKNAYFQHIDDLG